MQWRITVRALYSLQYADNRKLHSLDTIQSSSQATVPAQPRSHATSKPSMKTHSSMKNTTRHEPYPSHGNKSTTGRRADTNFLIGHCQTGGSSSIRRWVVQDPTGTPPVSSQVNVLIQQLAYAVGEIGTNVPSVHGTLSYTNGLNGFTDDSLPSIVNRCRLAGDSTTTVEFLLMVHHLQLLCKCSRYVAI